MAGRGRMRRSLCGIGVLLLTLGALASAQVQEPIAIPPFTITISTPQSTVKLHSAVTLIITMVNASDHDIYYDVGSGAGVSERIFRTVVIDCDGNPAQETAYGMKVHGTEPNQHGGSAFGGRFPVKPGGTVKEEVVLSKEFNLDKPGQYTIQAEHTDPESRVSVKSNVITVTVIR